jgi:hypothetical protein
MKKFTLLRFLLFMQVLLFVTGCEPENEILNEEPAFAVQDFTLTATGDYLEDFENASKSSYAGDSVSFADGNWYFQEALIGSLDSDAKNGFRSVRMRYNGVITMNFDLPDGAKSVSLSYAKYGRDSQTSFALY